jgi:hypothetical protein
MKVFITWSGFRSKAVAKGLHDWLPSVLQDVDPWMSEEDMASGTHWPTHLGSELHEANFGIICLTPENRDQRWILFEAGSLSNALEGGRVCPYLLGLENADVPPPLGLFQASKADKEGTRKLIQSINDSLEKVKGKYLSPQRLDTSFERFWQDLDKILIDIPPPPPATERKKRPPDEISSEILEAVRAVGRDIAVLRQPDEISRAIFEAIHGVRREIAGDIAVLKDVMMGLGTVMPSTQPQINRVPDIMSLDEESREDVLRELFRTPQEILGTRGRKQLQRLAERAKASNEKLEKLIKDATSQTRKRQMKRGR